jgi:hypothetical protein
MISTNKEIFNWIGRKPTERKTHPEIKEPEKD